MAVTENFYTGNGSTTLYSFTFPYLDEADIKVTLNGSPTTAYTLANATTVSFNAAPANGAAIRIYRETDDTEAYSTFFPGSAVRAQDLNQNFLQSLYIGQESTNESNSASTAAASAVTAANTAVSTANTASTNASAAVSTANTANANASAAVSTANTASTNASNAVTTANSASAAAAGAVTTANTASSNASSALSAANSAVTTANTASSNASAAVSTANTASSNASNAVSTANSATTTANNALTAANNAVSNSNTAVSTATSADIKATQAIAAVASAALYTVVANVAAIPAAPANNTAIEVTDSTGIQSFTPLTGLPAGFTGSPGLSVRIIYSTTGPTWNWIQYFPNDPENRYLKLSGGTLTGQLKGDDSTSPSTPGFAFDGDPDTGVGRSGANELNLITGGNIRLSIDGAGNISANSNLISSVDDPVSAQDAATKNYVDTAISGISTSSIQQGDSSVTVTDAGTGDVTITVDANPVSIYSTSSLNNYVSFYQQDSFHLTDQNELKFWEATANGLNSVGFKGPANIAADVTWTLPSADGTNGQALTTNGSGTLSWSAPVDATKLPLSGGTMTGNITFNGGQTFPGVVASTGGTITGNVRLDNQSDLRFGEATANGSNYVGFQAPANIPSDVLWTLPATDAAVAGYALKSDGLGNLSWGLAGGASGGGANQIFYENDQTVTTNYTITAGKNAMTAGPITINSSVVVTIPSGSSWSIV